MDGVVEEKNLSVNPSFKCHRKHTVRTKTCKNFDKILSFSLSTKLLLEPSSFGGGAKLFTEVKMILSEGADAK